MHNVRDFAGQGNFTWFMGVIEDREDPLKLGRVRVRCIGWHSANKEDVPTEDLPWAMTVSPVNGGSNGGKAPVEGTWVLGFFMDGNKAMRPVVFGSLPGIDSERPDPNQGFSDPKGVWPRFVGEASTSRLGRNDEGYEDAVVAAKKADAEKNQDIGDWTFNIGGFGGMLKAAAGAAIDSITGAISDTVGELATDISNAVGDVGAGINEALKNAQEALQGVAPGIGDMLSGQNSLISLQQIRRVVTEVGPLVGLQPNVATNVLKGLDSFDLGVTLTTLRPEQIVHAAKNLATDQVLSALKTGNTSQIKYFFKNISPSEINRILVSSSASDRVSVMTTMNPTDRATVLARMNPNNRANIFDGLSKDQVTEVLYGVSNIGLQKITNGIKSADAQRIVGVLGPQAVNAMTSIISGKGVPAGLLSMNNVLSTAAAISPNLAKTVQVATKLADIFKIDLSKSLNLLPEGLRSEVTAFLTKAFPFPFPPPRPIGSQIGNTWSENPPAYKATYPYNDVKQTESGHVIEIDDTKGQERIHIYHRTGTSVEIDPKGTVNIKGKGDKYEIWAGSNFCNVKGSVNLTIEGSCETYIAGDWNVKVGGNKTEIIGGNHRKEISGDYTEICMGGKQEQVVKTSAELVLGTKSLDVMLAYTEKMYTTHTSTVLSNRIAAVGGFDTTTVTGYRSATVGGYDSETVAGAKSVSVGEAYSITVGGYMSATVGASLSMSSGATTSITAGGPAIVSASIILLN